MTKAVSKGCSGYLVQGASLATQRTQGIVEDEAPWVGWGWILKDHVTHIKEVFLHLGDSENTFNDTKRDCNEIIFAL